MTHGRSAAGAAAAASVRALLDTGGLELPLPGGGGTLQRWRRLADWGAADLAVAKLAESHTDAVAVLAEIGAEPMGAGLLSGVWAADPPDARLAATSGHDGWRLTGRKAWCSGGACLDEALVTAFAEDGRRLFRVRPGEPGVTVVGGIWTGPGMARAGTVDLVFEAVPALAVGGPRAYLDRPGFWAGGIGVAAVWWGAARAIGDRLVTACDERSSAHTLAHLGSCDVLLSGCEAAFERSAGRVDAGAAVREQQLEALRIRALVERTAAEVVDRVGRALGPGPLAHEEEHARRVADLAVFVRQAHAERDLEELGRLLVSAG